jgi:hypothetical protein
VFRGTLSASEKSSLFILLALLQKTGVDAVVMTTKIDPESDIPKKEPSGRRRKKRSPRRGNSPRVSRRSLRRSSGR